MLHKYRVHGNYCCNGKCSSWYIEISQLQLVKYSRPQILSPHASCNKEITNKQYLQRKG